ncbi:hypothetical protein FBU59_002462 [Linderina macrospora]|uniref:Uncharacterized protein n=1 Tax=Linderina macrospora TaxID=4868 RepID=A0ACC1JAZ7_9FUNG|nr:hypothetical protein FBU59_002462 [Linderina macrospora]
MVDKIRAVIFDIGGVVVKSPFIAISAYERKHSLPANYINVALSKLGSAGAFQKYERGETTYDEFVAAWTQELNDVSSNNAAYRKYIERRSLDRHMILPSQTHIDGHELFTKMMEVAREPNDNVVEFVRGLRRSGYKTAALTNNFQNDSTSGETRDWLLDPLFDEFVESSVVGLRKPDPKFYLHACNKLGVRPSEAVFLDDIPMNLRAAKNLGMAVVQVRIGQEDVAIGEVRAILAARGALSSARL